MKFIMEDIRTVEEDMITTEPFEEYPELLETLLQPRSPLALYISAPILEELWVSKYTSGYVFHAYPNYSATSREDRYLSACFNYYNLGCEFWSVKSSHAVKIYDSTSPLPQK